MRDGARLVLYRCLTAEHGAELSGVGVNDTARAERREAMSTSQRKIYGTHVGERKAYENGTRKKPVRTARGDCVEQAYRNWRRAEHPRWTRRLHEGSVGRRAGRRACELEAKIPGVAISQKRGRCPQTRKRHKHAIGGACAMRVVRLGGATTETARSLTRETGPRAQKLILTWTGRITQASRPRIIR